MDKWKYLKEVKKEKFEEFCKNYREKHPKQLCGYATATSNNPGMVAIYTKEKTSKPT
ncbi:hypothetical protein GF326_02240 [Candidatus Bathyarchaeota archaeon]|nr:hypothetical protein [Candidatus Bathyarchaeota archaeon]